MREGRKEIDDEGGRREDLKEGGSALGVGEAVGPKAEEQDDHDRHAQLCVRARASTLAISSTCYILYLIPLLHHLIQVTCSLSI